MNHYQKLNHIFQYFLALVGFTGILGNLLTFCVFRRQRLRKFSYSFYSRVMVCSDVIVLLHTFRHWAATIFNANIDLVASFLCTIDEYQPYVATFTSLWLLTLISIDRLVTIAFPTRFKFLKARWFQVTLVLVVIAYSFLVNILLPLNYRLDVANQTNSSSSSAQAAARCSISPEVASRQSWIYLVNILFLTLIANNIISLWMVFFIFLSRKKLTSLSSRRQSTVRDKKFALSSIGLNMCSLVCKLPFSIGLLVASYVNLDPDLNDLIFTINIVVLDAENGAAFIVNILVNSIFYNEFLNMFGFKKRI